MYWQDILARVSAVHSRLQAAGPVLERRPLSICRGLLDSRREREGRWQGTRSYGPAAREALQPQA